MKLGVLQFKPEFGDIEQNICKIQTLINQSESCDVLVLPELCTTGYQFVSRQEVFDLAEGHDGRLASALTDIAVNRQMALVAGFAERDGDRVFNSAMLVNHRGDIFIYRKAHLFYKENDFFTPGDTPFHPIILENGLKVGVMVCFDWIFPEVVRTYALNGADIIAHPSNLVLPWCQKAMFARAVENRVVIATSNRTGTEERAGETLTFTGMSQIMGADGQVLAGAGKSDDGVFVTDIDLKNNDKQLNRYNHLFKNRRTDLYFK